MAETDSQRICARYVKALYELASEAGAVDAVARDMAQLGALAAQAEEFADFLANPVLTRTQKARAADAVAAQTGAHELTRRFLQTLAGNRRLFMLAGMAEAFAAYVAARRGIARAKVVSAAPLSPSGREQLRQALARASGGEVEIIEKLNPSLLGGVTVEIGGTMLDGSLAGKLRRLEQTLKHSAKAA